MRDEKLHAIVARSTFRSQNVIKTQGFGQLLEVAMLKKCTPLWREAHFQVKRTTFGSCDVEKVHPVVARSTCPSQNVKSTRGSDNFWKLRCRKSARCCGAKHISKWKCTKHTMFGHFWKFRCGFAWQAQGIVHLVKSEQNVRVLQHFQLQPPLHHTTLQYMTLHYNYNYTFTTVYYTTLHYTTLHSITFNYTRLHYTTLHSTTLHYTTLHYTTFHYTSLHYTTLHNTTTTTTQLHSTTLNYTTLHYITLHSTRLHYTALHYTTLHYTTLH